MQVQFSLNNRAMTSSELPAGAGTMILTGFDGQPCARAGVTPKAQIHRSTDTTGSSSCAVASL
jgi:hypothetical protein